MVFIESPTNPRMKLVDISALTKMVHERDKDVIIVMDNTFLTPFFQVINLCYLFYNNFINL